MGKREVDLNVGIVLVFYITTLNIQSQRLGVLAMWSGSSDWQLKSTVQNVHFASP